MGFFANQNNAAGKAELAEFNRGFCAGLSCADDDKSLCLRRVAHPDPDP
jgi:hypothetical protein